MVPSAVYPTAQSPAVHSSQQYGVVVARSPVLSSYGPYGSVFLSPSMVPYHGWSPYPVGESKSTISNFMPYLVHALFNCMMSPSGNGWPGCLSKCSTFYGVEFSVWSNPTISTGVRFPWTISTFTSLFRCFKRLPKRTVISREAWPT